jgi:tripeptidyl-peptidase I
MTEPFQVLSSSYGESEDTQSLAFAQKLCSTYAQLGARGTSIIYGSGDGGVCGTLPANCSDSSFFPTFPSGCP